jgi:hypothetical protein
MGTVVELFPEEEDHYAIFTKTMEWAHDVIGDAVAKVLHENDDYLDYEDFISILEHVTAGVREASAINSERLKARIAEMTQKGAV